jgi:hypothetical protein
MGHLKFKIAGALVLFSGLIAGMHYLHTPASDAAPSASADVTASGRPGFADLQKHVQKLAAIDDLCKKQDASTCYCELADRIRNEHDAIARLLMDDPALRGFVIAVRQPASEQPAQRYDLNKLPQVPDEKKCLSTVAAPTLIDGEAQEI